MYINDVLCIFETWVNKSRTQLQQHRLKPRIKLKCARWMFAIVGKSYSPTICNRSILALIYISDEPPNSKCGERDIT